MMQSVYCCLRWSTNSLFFFKLKFINKKKLNVYSKTFNGSEKYCLKLHTAREKITIAMTIFIYFLFFATI